MNLVHAVACLAQLQAIASSIFFIAWKNFSFALERSSLILLIHLLIGSYSHFEQVIVMQVISAAITGVLPVFAAFFETVFMNSHVMLCPRDTILD